MTRKKLNKIIAEIRMFEQSQPKVEALIRLAKALGRIEDTKRGKEPTYISTEFLTLRPLSIPKHKGRDMRVGTKNNILVQLGDDVWCWDERLTNDENGGTDEQ